MYYAVIQKGQSMVHSSSEFEDKTVRSYINQDAKDPYHIIDGQG